MFVSSTDVSVSLSVSSLDVIEQVEDTIGGLKVIDVADNFIRLSLHTHIPNLEDFSSLEKLEGTIEPSELDHELLVEVLEGTMELKNAEVSLYLIKVPRYIASTIILVHLLLEFKCWAIPSVGTPLSLSHLCNFC